MLAEKFPGDVLQVGTGQWLVASEGTVQSVSEKIGVVPGQSVLGGLLVLGVSAYWGWKSPQIWDWFKAKWGSV